MQQLWGLRVTDGAVDIGEFWGSVIDRYSWTVSHVVVQTGGRFTDQAILVSRHARAGVDVSHEMLLVSLDRAASRKEDEDAVPDSDDSPYVTRLKVSVDPPEGWAISRPLAVPAFPMPAVSSYYVKVVSPSPQSIGPSESRPQCCRDPIGSQVHTADGGAGVVCDLLVEDGDRKVRLDTGTWLSARRVILSTLWLKHAAAGDLYVDVPAARIETGPEFDPAVPLGQATESRVFTHDGRRPYWDTERS
jgi:hypothetical protein